MRKYFECLNIKKKIEIIYEQKNNFKSSEFKF